MAKEKAKKGTLGKVLRYIGRYKLLLVLSSLLALVSVALTLLVPILIGDAIEGQYTANNLHFAAAIALLLMIVLLVCMALMQRYANRKAVA